MRKLLTLRPEADDLVKARIQHALKEDAVAVLAELGIKPSEFIRMAFSQVATTRALPAEIARQRRITTAAMAEISAGAGKRYPNAKALFDDLNSDSDE